jgi:hypothetical protein
LKTTNLRVSDLINPAQIIDGFIITDTDKPIAIYRLKGGINTITADDSAITRAIDGFKQAFNVLKPGEEVQIIVQTNNFNPDDIIFKFNKNIDPKHPIEKYKTTYPNYMDNYLKDFCRDNKILSYNFYVLFTYVPQAVVIKSAFNFLQKKKTVKKDIVALKKDINLRSKPFLTTLKSCNVEVEDLTADNIYNILDKALNPTSAGETSTLTKAKNSLYDLKSSLARTPLAESHDKIVLGNQCIKTVYIADIPETPGIIQDLFFKHNLFTLTLYAKGVSQQDIKAGLKRKLKLSISAGGGAADVENQTISQDTRDLLAAQSRGEIKFINFACYLSFENPDDEVLQEITPEFINTFQDSNLFYEGFFEQTDLWLSTLPLMMNNETAKHYFLTLTGAPTGYMTGNLANLFPFYNFEFDNSEGGVLLGTSATGQPAIYNPYSKKLINGNHVILGRAGSGKSFYINLILNRISPWRPEIIIIDKSKSYEFLCKCNQGEYISIGLADNNAYNVFDCLDYDKSLKDDQGDDNDINSKGDPTAQKISFITGLFDIILGEEGEKRLNKLDSSLIEKVIKRTYHDKLKIKDGIIDRKTIPLLSDCIKTIDKLVKENDNNDWKSELLQIKEKLGPFTGQGTYANLLDRTTTIELKSSFIVFDISTVPPRDDIQSLAVYIISSFAMQRFKINKKLGKRQILCIDEAWYLARFTAGIDFLLNLAKRSRHLGLMVLTATQQIGDFLHNAEAAAVIQNAASTTLFSQAATDMPHFKRLLNLTDREAQIITTLHQERGKYSQAFVILGEQKNTVYVRADKILRWIATSEPTYDVPAKNAEIEKVKDPWKAIINLIERGI